MYLVLCYASGGFYCKEILKSDNVTTAPIGFTRGFHKMSYTLPFVHNFAKWKEFFRCETTICKGKHLPSFLKFFVLIKLEEISVSVGTIFDNDAYLLYMFFNHMFSYTFLEVMSRVACLQFAVCSSEFRSSSVRS